MQRPAQIQWEEPRCIGELPRKRSGHTLTEIDSFAYLFGGCVAVDRETDPGPTNELFKLDFGSNSEFYWTKVGTDGIQPAPRWQHSANKLNDSQIVVFGGFTASKSHPWLNDVWIFDTKSELWSELDPKLCEGTKLPEHDRGRWSKGTILSEPPAPRGCHSTTILDHCLLLFGGYGGSGFTRRDFNDVHALCLNTWQWHKVQPSGNPPPPRSGHKSVAMEGQLFVMGGWSSSEQFDDVHILDGESLAWSQPKTACGPDSWGPPRWNFTAVSVIAVPHWKVFVFGGNSGDLSSMGHQGIYRNDIQVLEPAASQEAEAPLLSWSRPAVGGDLPPPRADTQMFYSATTGKLFLFGGWSNRYHGDLRTCRVAEVVGPPYNISSIGSVEWTLPIGPVTGNSKMLIRGKGFKSVPGAVVIRFSCAKGFLEVTGDILSDCEVTLVTPNYETIGAVETEVRLKIGSHSFSNATAAFNFFSVTDSSKTVAFGPGVLEGNKVNVPTSFVIQAKDKASNYRTCGMDQFCVRVQNVDTSSNVCGDDNDDGTDSGKTVAVTVQDCKDGTYIVEYVPLNAGRYRISVVFHGTFGGQAGAICGSPFFMVAAEDADVSSNSMDGALLRSHIIASTKALKEFCSTTGKGLERAVDKDDVKTLVSIKEHLRNVAENRTSFDRNIATNKAALEYMKRTGRKNSAQDKLLNNLIKASDVWRETKSMAPKCSDRIGPIDSMWAETNKFKIEAYEKELEDKLKRFRKLPFWHYYGDESGEKIESEAARKSISDAEKALRREILTLDENAYLCKIFGLDGLIDRSHCIAEEMKRDLAEMNKLWDVKDHVESFIASSKKQLWSAIDTEALEDGGKAQLKSVKRLHKRTRWSDAYRSVDRICKDFLSTIPLVALIRTKAMRPRHWHRLVEATNATNFVPPYEDENLTLGGLIAVSLLEYRNEVEEINDQAIKEEKMEHTLEQINARWARIEFTMTPHKRHEGDAEIPLLGISEENFEALENDQLVIQSMLASRFVGEFKDQVNAWHKQLFNVNDVYLLVGDIQRNWSYLEPLFIHSDEVKKELPEDTTRFTSINSNVRHTLLTAWETKNVIDAFNKEGMLENLENIQEQLDMCKKSLADYLDGRRRQFPRYYFVSEADLLDILSNGGRPENILSHIPKIYLSTKTITLSPVDEETPSGRPVATEFVAGVGSEVCTFEPHVPLEGKVEIYMQTILDHQKKSIFATLGRSLARYHEVSRPEWILSKDNETGRSADPAQTTLLVLAINYVEEVEQIFQDISDGKQNALAEYSKKQVDQLGDLITLTQSNLSKGDRTRVMVCITMDAHARDVVEKMIRNKVEAIDSFMWQSQLKHKFRKSPSHARFQNRDSELRGEGGERAEVAICDAILPYDYEYLGNCPRLVITPLTDRVYVTATQALNLKMGCAPAGPAGTGKTETTKDLANAVAKLIYVINCSPEMDYKGLGNIFKGVASTGAWVCFDEFNRLIPEVLSVCTVQFRAICDGIAADVVRIRIEGEETHLDPTCGAFITMNPGYLGRSELPEGLKALFRPMTVMAPDLILICENMLMAEGFVTAKALASKFFCLYSLLKALLSSQLHYDWGLRAIKSVLVVAGSFKRAEPDLAEDALLMRALRDFNIPKIVREDEVIFFGLLGDLFPGLDPPRKRDEHLESYVVKACEKLGNDPDDVFRLKVVQLEELLNIRHCVFIMGPAGCGKSTVWRTLHEARDLRDPDRPTKVVDLNPKAVRTEELYGFISLNTREWRDGLLSNVMRNLSSIPDDKKKWIVLDGDLDANWIESMNSVMDDNRMLTLASNERIPLLPHMNMIFEIRDLKHATPATVSRAGILYISTDDGTQWRSLINSWIAKKRARYSKDIVAALAKCFSKYVSESLLWLLINTKAIVPIEDVNRVQVLLYMLDGCLNEHNTTSPEAVEVAFVYCAVWALGSNLCVSDEGTDYRKLFSDWWRKEWKDVKFPSRDTVFDYWLHPQANAFDSWTKSPFFFSVDYDSRTTPMTQVTIPTPEGSSIAYWMDVLVKEGRPIMLAGPAGTGKTQLVNGMLNQFDPSSMLSTTINFNFYTTASVLANTMQIPLEKKTGSNFAPAGTAKFLYYFVDDLNLPEVDAYNTQSAIAHLRQHMEYGHCYDLNKMTLKNITNTQVIACMNPTAGCFHINPRLQRWFSTFAVNLPGSTSLFTIYQSFLDGHLKPFDKDVRSQSNNLVKAAMGLHALVSSTFRKTAANFHYEFNIRHISNVFQGLLVSKPEQFQSPEKIVHLWLHESERVYGDRLVDENDTKKFNVCLQSQCKKVFPNFPIAKFYASQNADPLVFCHFASENMQESLYDQVTSMDSMNSILENSLREYNETNATMDLVLFEDAMKHVARIVRIVRNEGGHALLVGVGGSGKQSLARLAAFMCGYTVMQIVVSSTYSINDLKDDLKLMYNKAGVKDEGVMFLLNDSQITNEKFLIYINDLLASGNIPDLFANDEVDAIVSALSNRVKARGILPERKNCWDFFISAIRKNLHMCLCFSPVGDSFRNRARKFPALVTCSVIDMFHPWPRDALFSVAKKFLSSVDLGSGGERGVIERFLPFSFEAVNKATVDFRRREGRFVYTTPKSYLDLIKLYRSLLGEKRSEAAAAIQRLENGLLKLRSTAESVAKLEEELVEMLDDAAVKKTKAEGIAEVVAKEKAEVEVQTSNAQIEREQVSQIAEEVSKRKRDTEADLAKAEPAVEAAMSALDTLDQKDISSCKGMLKPPPKLDEVFAATMCLLAGIMPTIVVQKNGRVKDTSWDAAKKQLMGNIKEYMKYLKEVKTHVDNSTINHNNFKEVRQYIEKDYFNVEAMKAKNPAAAGLCSFVLNIVNYYDIFVSVEPKRKALADANAQFEEATMKLEVVEKSVAQLEQQLAKLTKDFEEANSSKQEAMDCAERGGKKLNLAQRLITALGSENQRWAENVLVLRRDAKLLTGDVLLASVFIIMLGPFTMPFRVSLMDGVFKRHLSLELRKVTEDVPMSVKADPVRILSTTAEVAQWNAHQLPADLVSTENGCIVCNTSRWPLLIDPQLQGIRWLRNKESSPHRNLQIVRLGQKDLLQKLELALENGHAFLIENLGESIDAVLYPLIQRATIKRGARYFIKIGEKECDFHPNFQLYLHTKLSNPHYPPEIQAETTLINFTVTKLGLEDQLLDLVVQKERPDLAALSADLVKQQNSFTISIKDLEDNILSQISAAEGDITDDVALIEGLEETKNISDDMEQQSALAKQTQENILVTRERYRSVANRSSLLFFFMNDLVKIHSYYIYSLQAFKQVFFRGIDAVKSHVAAYEEKKDDGTEDDGEEEGSTLTELTPEQTTLRCNELIDSITMTVFNYIRRGLLEVDKLTVATLLTLRILVNEEKMDPGDVDYLVLGGKVNEDPGNMGPLQEWLPDTVWPKVKALETMSRFKGLGDSMQGDSDEWNSWFEEEAPESVKLPGDQNVTSFERLILLRAMRPDRLMKCLRTYIGDVMGHQYVSQRPFNMKQTFDETSNRTPIFFVLFAGVDPTPWVESLGKELGISAVNISMGQGQEAPAEAVVARCAKEGGWVMLQNCHLMNSWVPKLERLLEVVSEGAHEDFRCFISAEPPPIPSWRNMPESLMQSCIKVANEAPADIQSNLIRAWDSFSPDVINECAKPTEMKACLFSLCWFHAIVCGRRRFGQQGWSRKYSFNTGDLIISSNVLRSYLDANPVVPWDDLRYIFGEIMYGGHITDAWDRRTCNTYLQVYQDPNLFHGLEFAPGFKSPPPEQLDFNGYIKYAETSMPPECPSLFGLHPNAEIGYLTNSTETLFSNIISMNGGSSGDETGGSDMVKNTMQSLVERLPEEFEMVSLTLKAKPMLSGPSGPYIVVALQECGRMNILLSAMKKSLSDLEKGLKGQLNMSQELEDLASALKINQWPGRSPFSKCTWEKHAWPSKKNLMAQFSDMILRVEQLRQWTADLNTPTSIWLPGLFNPSSYLTAVLQVTARKTGVALDEMTIETHATTMWDCTEVKESAVDGTYIHGLFIEGARWPKGEEAGETFTVSGTSCSGSLCESKLKELMPPMPVIYVKAVPILKEWESSPVGYLRGDPAIFECPVYTTTFRGPTYVFLATLRTKAPAAKWVLGSVALMLQTDE